ncbi:MULTISPECIES: HPr family phosphocarrier protein [Brevibacillus]|uniref:Phosphocarrier protein HPr n=2 Tax=Brevibacillus TaxID=55080 RepID=A0A0F7EFI3_BRELA|nr:MULTISPECIES: HPr family phosphocarrier protein [Brevibacillus]QOS97488.1 HPr family phosphocarrier protein [Brevibacterium sp. JNUCC-42]AKF92584.1 PTS sugar transporter subunit IIA [Brevibacillus laterosporus]ATO50219.1 PTS sugar transporter subunit IIA [Brevibacillus laterosporus DSM 25]AYB39597.1 HPr family phosphocarrier protein [Brevibacillus laterosporus]MBG9771813.1 PTS sugar transporter subunit IIA [Brevibacillus laterosporus]
MLTKTCVIQNPAGLHARPATMFVQKATSFSCDVNLIKGTKKINGKSIMGVMTLAAKKGDEIVLEVSGENEAQALEELGAILESAKE